MQYVKSISFVICDPFSLHNSVFITFLVHSTHTKIYVTIIKPTKHETNLIVFVRKIQRKIYGSVQILEQWIVETK